MSGSTDIKFTSDEADLVKGQDKLIKKQNELIDSLRKTGRQGRDAAKDLDRFARVTKDINRTPLERYADEMRKLDRALKAGKIDQETFNRAVEKAQSAYRQAGAASKQAGDQHREAFGASAITRMAGLISVADGVRRAFGYVAETIRAANAEVDAMSQKQAEQAPSLGMLAQVADTQEEFQRLVGEAKKTHAEGGARTLPEAAALQFALESGDAGYLRADFSRLQATGLVPNATMMAESAIKLIAGMGAKEAGDFRTVVSKAFGGAKLGLGSAEELLASTASVSAQASRLGLSDEEVMAAVSTVSAIEGPAEAATQIQALLKGIEVEGIGGGFLQPGRTLREQVAALRELEASGVDIRDMLGGRQEAVKGFGQLASERGAASVEANLANIARAEREDWFGQKVEMAGGLPENAAALLKRKATAQAEQAGLRVTTLETVADALAEDLVADLRERGAGEFKVQEARKIFERRRGHTTLGAWTGGSDETFIREFSRFGSEDTQRSIDVILQKLTDVSDNMRGASEDLRGAAAETGRDLTNAARANAAAVGGAVEAR